MLTPLTSSTGDELRGNCFSHSTFIFLGLNIPPFFIFTLILEYLFVAKDVEIFTSYFFIYQLVYISVRVKMKKHLSK